MHFVIPRAYESIVPDYLPAHRTLVYASGIAEIAGGAAVLHSRTRAAGSWWSIATLVAVSRPTCTWRCTPTATRRFRADARP